MLFLADLLKFKTAFGKLWLAGTVGAKKRPFNKEIILSSDIEEFVEALFNVEVPLAPRLSGTLLCGVCNIYDQKCHFLYMDVLSLFRKLYHDNATATRKLTEGPNPTRRRRTKQQQKHELAEAPSHSATAVMIENQPAELEAMLADLDIDNVSLFFPEDPQPEDDALDVFVRSQLQNTANAVTVCTNPSNDSMPSSASYVVPLDSTSYLLEDHAELPEEELVDNFALAAQEVQEQEDEAGCSLSSSKSGDQAVSLVVVDDAPDHLKSPHEETTPPPLDPAPPQRSAGRAEVKRYNAKNQHLRWTADVDATTTLSDVMLTEWRKDCSAIKHKAVASVASVDRSPRRRPDWCPELSPPPRLSKLLRRLTPTPAAATVAQKHTTRVMEEDVQPNGSPYALEDDQPFPNRFDNIERLRGIFDGQEQSTEDAGSDRRFLNRTRQSLQTDVSRSSITDDFGPFSGLGRDSIAASEGLSSFRDSLMGAPPPSLYAANEFSIGAPQGTSCSLTSRHSMSSSVSIGHDSDTAHFSMGDDSSLLIETATQQRSWDYGRASFSRGGAPDEDQVLRILQSSYTLETWKFRTLIESQLAETTSKGLCFSQLVPPGSVTSLVAARSFYHLLVLASSGDIDVHQESTDIRITQSCSLSDFEDPTPERSLATVCSPRSACAVEVKQHQHELQQHYSAQQQRQAPVLISAHENRL